MFPLFLYIKNLYFKRLSGCEWIILQKIFVDLSQWTNSGQGFILASFLQKIGRITVGTVLGSIQTPIPKRKMEGGNKID